MLIIDEVWEAVNGSNIGNLSCPQVQEIKTLADTTMSTKPPVTIDSLSLEGKYFTHSRSNR